MLSAGGETTVNGESARDKGWRAVLSRAHDPDLAGTLRDRLRMSKGGEANAIGDGLCVDSSVLVHFCLGQIYLTSFAPSVARENFLSPSTPSDTDNAPTVAAEHALECKIELVQPEKENRGP